MYKQSSWPLNRLVRLNSEFYKIPANGCPKKKSSWTQNFVLIDDKSSTSVQGVGSIGFLNLSSFKGGEAKGIPSCKLKLMR